MGRISPRLRITSLLAVVLLGGAGPAGAEVFCNASGLDPRVPMPVSHALPYGAVGYLDNGCTATLVDKRYIVTAAHCLSRTWSDGSWMPVYFVPNFNTSTAPAFVEVDRGVVGRRTDSVDGAQHDWAIGHLARAVIDYPSMVVAPQQPSVPYQVANAGYGRDLNRTAPGSKPAGAPCQNEYCQKNTNVWWQNALVHFNCSVQSNTDNVAATDCAVVGGNSGSPLFRGVRASDSRRVEYQVMGVISGGPSSFKYQEVSTSKPSEPNRRCVRRRPNGPLNVGPASPEFRYAPYFATAAAAVPTAPKSKRSLVVAADSDASRFVARERDGSKVTDRFADYGFFGFLLKPTALTGLVQPDGNSALAAIASTGRLFVRLAAGAGEWDHWRELDRPAGVSKVVDVDSLEGGKGELYIVASDGRAFRRHLEGSSWSAWQQLAGSGYSKISAARTAGGQRRVFLLKPSGRIYVSKSGSAWSAKLTTPVWFASSTFAKLREVDAVTDAAGSMNVFALDSSGNLWTRRTSGKSPDWLDWVRWKPVLFAPPAASQSAASAAAKKYGFWQETTGPVLPDITSLTATRWSEAGTSSVANTVVFATDSRGNVYTTGYRCAGSAKPVSCYWTGWRTFTE